MKIKLRRGRQGRHKGEFQKPHKQHCPKKLTRDYKELSSQDWLELKKLHFSDPIKFSFESLSHKYGICVGTIRDHSSTEGWKEQKEAINEKAKEKMLDEIGEMFVKAGLPDSKLIELIAEGAKRTMMLSNIYKVYENLNLPRESKNGKSTRIYKLKPFSIMETIEVIDNKTTQLYRDMVCKMRGLYAAPKQAVDSERGSRGKNAIPVVSHINIPEATNDL